MIAQQALPKYSWWSVRWQPLDAVFIVYDDITTMLRFIRLLTHTTANDHTARQAEGAGELCL